MVKGMVPAGKFRMKNDASADALPVHNPSGLWQAWKAPDGRFMIRPLDRDEKLWGTAHMMGPREFAATLETAFESDEETRARQDGSPETDLLAQWYDLEIMEQAARGAPVPGAPVAGLTVQGNLPAGRPEPARKKSRMSSDEAILEPSWDPDEIFPDEEKTAEDAGDEDMLTEVFAQEKLSARNPLDFMPSLSLEIDPAPKAATEKAKDKTDELGELQDGELQDGEPDARARFLEKRIRQEFDVLLERFDKKGGPEVERDLSRLILRGESFSWNHKFMFTEFGFALRRRRLYKLAMASHSRALGLSPKDEHVLFNVARSEYELGEIEKARVYLIRALEAAPNFDAARRFLTFLEGFVPEKNDRPKQR